MPFPNILRLQGDKWENPEDSVGTFIGYLNRGRYRCWEAAGPARLAFRELSPEIKDCLESSSIPPTDIVSWSIYMIGHTENNAAPKILICSTDLRTRKNIRKLIKDSKIMDKYPGIGLGDVSALPDRHVIKELSREAIEDILPPGCDIDGAVLAYYPKPRRGKRIFIVNPHDFSLRPATTGPTILKDGKYYQLTVAHVFRHTRKLNESSDQQMVEDDCDFDGMSDADESQYDEMTRKGSATPGEIDSDKASFMASLDAISDDKHSSSRSESPLSDHLDSGKDLRPSVESTGDSPSFDEIDVSQLQYFGKLISSSLTGRNPSLDYALVEASTTLRIFGIESDLVWGLGEIGSDDIDILATTSRQHEIKGRLTATPSYIRLPGQCTFQQVYPVRLDEPLIDGDCGTPVFSKWDDLFYGHIVAGGPGTSIAYLVPALDISKDIQAQLGFDFMGMTQQGEQHTKYDLQLGPGASPDWANSGETSIKKLGASSTSGIPPKRQSSPLTDDKMTDEHPLLKRHQSAKTIHDLPDGLSNEYARRPVSLVKRSPRLRQKSPASLAYIKRARRDATLSRLSQTAVDATQEVQKRTQDTPLFSESGIGSSSTQEGKAAGKDASRLVLPEDFIDISETCFFWLYSPDHFSSIERYSCSGRKEELSHIITHAADHHGLIRGSDPKNASRKYLASCRTNDPLVKAKGNCEKCRSLHKWNDEDFADPTHHGVVICLRCWRKFDKKEMKEHLAGPICEYRAEQPKARKTWLLYTTFCSETQLPSRPPKSTALRKVPRRASRLRMGQAQQQFSETESAASVGDLDATTSPPGTHSLLQRMRFSQPHVPSTAEVPIIHWSDERLKGVLDPWEGMLADHIELTNSTTMDPVSHNLLEAADFSPRLPTDQHQDSAPESKLPADRQSSLERDSGYYTAR